MAAAIAFQTLGPVSLTDAEGREVHALLAQPRRLALLAYLAVAVPRGLQRRDAILTLFWPELDQQHARAALRQALRVIRGSLGDVITSRGDDEIGLDFERLQCDTDAFDRAITGGLWDEALALYRGDLLDGFFISGAPEFERWLDERRARLRAAAVAAARALVERATEVGDVAGAAQWAERGLRLAPLDEALVRQLIGILDRLGDRAGAVQTYEDFARRLEQELEVRPSAETQALLGAVRGREMASAPIELRTPAIAGLPPSGERRAPRPVVMALAAGLPAAAVVALLVGFNLGGWRGRFERGGNVPTPPTVNRDAYDLYLQGKIRTRRESREDDSVAATLFERAVALDPRFAAAQAELARAYAVRVSQFAPDDSAALQRAQVAAEQALRLDPYLAEAHQAQATLLWGTIGGFAHERAIREDKRALALNPNLERAHQQLGNIYLHIGLLDEAIDELDKALAISPRDDNALRRIAEARAYQGRYADALRILRQVPPESNRPLWTYEMAVVLLHLGKSDEALAVLQGYLSAHPEDRGGVVTSARATRYAMAGDRRRAEQDIQTAIQAGKGYIHFHHAGYHIAVAYALLHQPDSAVQWLRRVADGGLPCYPLFERDPFLDNIRTDRGFVAFLREQKAQWERFHGTL
jgi:DNA-binding SARP family transcriptional activator